MQQETVWAIHNFEAEAEDEISFHIGEPILVIQKDELYHDGWWEVRYTHARSPAPRTDQYRQPA
jgi:hypothetical protein